MEDLTQGASSGQSGSLAEPAAPTRAFTPVFDQSLALAQYGVQTLSDPWFDGFSARPLSDNFYSLYEDDATNFASPIANPFQCSSYNYFDGPVFNSPQGPVSPLDWSPPGSPLGAPTPASAFEAPTPSTPVSSGRQTPALTFAASTPASVAGAPTPQGQATGNLIAINREPKPSRARPAVTANARFCRFGCGFSTTIKLWRHELVHQKPGAGAPCRWFACCCLYETGRKDSLKRHMEKTCLGGEGSYICKCHTTFVDRRLFLQHLEHCGPRRGRPRKHPVAVAALVGEAAGRMG